VISRSWHRALFGARKPALKSCRDPAEITHMFFQITGLYFAGRRDPWIAPGLARAWDGVATAGEVAPLPVRALPLGQQVRRWGALLAVAGLVLPGLTTAAALADDRPPAGSVARGTGSASGSVTPGGLPSGAAGDDTAPATAAPWEAGVVEADGKPLPSAPPPGPVPVDGIPLPAVAAPSTSATPAPVPAAPKADPAPGETVRLVPNQSAVATVGRDDDLVPADREYLRPILIRYAQENGLPADLVMSLAWVESSWRRSVVSDVGAVGVMQLMPNTVEYVSKKLLGLRSNLDPRNPTSNVRMGTKYLRRLLDQNHGNIRQALIAYNQGLTSVKANGSYGVAERYADRVLALRPQFRSA
jgi:soluble lytic murein transglycosylase-like protein